MRLKDRRPAGDLRVAGGFATPPLPTGEGVMIAGADLFRFEDGRGVIERRLRLPGGERIAARPAKLGTAAVILGERALHLVDGAVLGGGAARSGDIAVPLPGRIGDLRRLDAVRLPDRTMISFFFGRDSIEGPSAAWQQVVSIGADGKVRPLARRALGPDLPAGLRFRGYWLSPGIRALAAAAGEIGAPETPVFRRAPVQVPHGIWITAALATSIAVGVALLLTRRRRRRGAAVVGWTVATLAFGPPMLVAFWLVGQRQRT